MLCYIRTDSVVGFSSTVHKYMYAVGSSLLAIICSMFHVRCSMFDVRCLMFDVRCSMFGVRRSIFAAHCTANWPLMFNEVQYSLLICSKKDNFPLTIYLKKFDYFCYCNTCITNSPLFIAHQNELLYEYIMARILFLAIIFHNWFCHILYITYIMVYSWLTYRHFFSSFLLQNSRIHIFIFFRKLPAKKNMVSH